LLVRIPELVGKSRPRQEIVAVIPDIDLDGPDRAEIFDRDPGGIPDPARPLKGRDPLGRKEAGVHEKDGLEALQEWPGQAVFEVLRWPLLAAVMIVGVALLYRLSAGESPIQWLGFISPGALVATAGWIVASGLFAVYTANFASYGKTYGALASIVVVLLWLWLSSLVVLVGAEVDGTRASTR